MDIQRKVYRTMATVAAGFVAGQVVSLLWRVATKAKPPRDTEDLEIATASAVTFAALLGGATAAAQTLAGRHALKAVAKHEAPTAQAGQAS